MAKLPVAKLSKIIPMLSSNHDGEVIAAVKAIIRTLNGSGASVHDLVEALAKKPKEKIVYQERIVYRDRIVEKVIEKPVYYPLRQQHEEPPTDVPVYNEASFEPLRADVLSWARPMLDSALLKPHETDFVGQMLRNAKTPAFRMSVKQAKWWNDLAGEFR